MAGEAADRGGAGAGPADHRSAPSFLGHAAARHAISCPSCWPISAAATTSSRPSSSNARRCTARTARAEMAPVGEVEFVNGIAAMSASGNYGPCRVAEAIVGHADLTLGARGARRAGSRDRASAAGASAASATACHGTAATRSASSPRAWCRRIWCAIRNSARASPSSPSSGSASNPGSITRNCRTRSISPARFPTPRSSSTMSAACSASAPMPAGRQEILAQLAQGHRRDRQMPERQRQARRRRHDLVRLRLP